jgi:hypothetical protein
LRTIAAYVADWRADYFVKQALTCHEKTSIIASPTEVVVRGAAALGRVRS